MAQQNQRKEKDFLFGIEEETKDMIADEEETKSNNINAAPNKCICGAKLIIKTAQTCYDDTKAIECDGCAQTVAGHTKVYHCKNKKTERHSEGYDLCQNCAFSVLNTDGFDSFIFETINTANKNKDNLIFSPFSILVAMTICMLGSDKNTLKQMLNVLYPNRADKSAKFKNAKQITKDIIKLCKFFNKQYTGNNGPIITIANKIWIETGYKVLPKYMNAAGVDSVGTMTGNAAQSAKAINDWCADHTNNKIRDVVTAQDLSDVKLVIANAIYFKGKFDKPFAKKSTRKNVEFYRNKNRNKVLSKVAMMYSDKSRWYVQKYNKCYDIVRLPYKNSNLSLIVAINDYSTRQKALLTTNDICKLENKWRHKKVKLYLPKFKYEFESNLNNTLKSMGIVDAFGDNSADFSNMTEANDLCIGNVIHKAMIEVKETGTEAAAVTVVTMRKKGCARRTDREPTVEIHFDHPFYFYIFDQDKKIVLFSGAFVGQK